MSKGKKIALWTVSVLLTVMFLFTGSMKLLTPDKVRPMFVHYGYAAWFATVIGLGEVAGAIGLMLPKIAPFAAAVLSVIMVGAFFTHFLHQEYSHALVPLVLLVLLIGVGYARFKELKASDPGQRS